jgi:hypothetical protein
MNWCIVVFFFLFTHHWFIFRMSPVPSLFKKCICEGLLQIFYNEIRLITKRILNPNNIFITQIIYDITKKIAEQANYFKEKSWMTSLTTSKVELLIFQLSTTEVSSALDHFNMWSSVRSGRQVNDLFVQQFSFSGFRGDDLNVIFYKNMPNLHNRYTVEFVYNEQACNEIRLIAK